MLVDGNWVNKMESNGRSKSRKLIKLVGPLFKGYGGISREFPASKTPNTQTANCLKLYVLQKVQNTL
jgi:hypothetical protein